MRTGGPFKVYVVDDDPDIVAFMTASLEAAGHNVGSSLVGSHAIPEIVRRRPDCVLIDLVMAELDGFEFARELCARRELRQCVFIMVTAKADDYWAKRAAEAGMHGFIAKPLDAGRFPEQVERIIDDTRRVRRPFEPPKDRLFPDRVDTAAPFRNGRKNHRSGPG